MVNTRKYYLAFHLLVVVVLVSAENRTVYYNASGIIVNHNYTEEFLEDDCGSCQNLTSDLTTGFERMLDFFEKFKIYQDASAKNTNRSIEGVFFRSPSSQTPDYSISLEERKKIHVTERLRHHEQESLATKWDISIEGYLSGLYFILVLRLDFELPNPDRDWSALKEKIINSAWAYMRALAHFQFHNVLLNETSFEFGEIPEDQIDEYLRSLRLKPKTPKIAPPKLEPQNIHRQILRVTSFVGCALSGVALLATLLTIVMFRKISRLIQNQIMAQLCIAYLAAMTLFLLNISLVSLSFMVLCRGLAALMHYVLLSCITWMSIHAYSLYKCLLSIFPQPIKFMGKAAVVGWVVPGVLVAVTLISSTKFYDYDTVKDEDFMCWLKGDAFYGAFLAPIALHLMINTGLVIIAPWKIRRRPRWRAYDVTESLRNFRTTFALLSLLEINWLIAGSAAVENHLVFQYLFTVTCSFQGCILSVYHWIVNKDFKEAWKSFFSNNRVMQESSINGISENNEVAFVLKLQVPQ